MSQPIDPSKLVSRTVDGVAADLPVITYTEQVLARKEAELRKYIEEKYTKIQNVEKELQQLSLEVKLTSGSKKAALELLRRKIEQSAERIKVAKVREEAAKQVLVAAQEVVTAEEAEKIQLCIDLKLMIEESAMQQYVRLEELTRKLDALNPRLANGAIEVLQGLRAKIAPHGAPSLSAAAAPAAANKDVPPATSSTQGGAADVAGRGEGDGMDPPLVGGAGGATEVPPGAGGTRQVPGENNRSKGGPEGGKHVALKGREGGKLRGSGRGRGCGKSGPMVLKQGADGGGGVGGAGGWTGAGFDPDEEEE